MKNLSDLSIAQLLSYRDQVLADIVKLRLLKHDNINDGIDSAIALQDSIVVDIINELRSRGMYTG